MPGSPTWRAALTRFLHLSARRSGAIVAFGLLLAAAGLWAAQHIAVDPSLEALLPDDDPLLPALDEVRQRVPSSTPLYLLVTSEDAALNRRLADEILEGARAWPETLYAMNRRDATYFLDRRLLFLPEEKLESLADNVEELVEWEECERLPGCANLDDRPDPPDREALRQDISAVPEVRTLLSLFGLRELPEDTAPSTNPSTNPSASPSAVSGTDGSGRAPANGGGDTPTAPADDDLGRLCSPEGDVCAVHVVLDGSASDLSFAQAMLDKSAALFASVRPEDAPASLRLETSGAYRNAPVTKQVVVRDLRLTAALSTGLMLLLVLVQFRFGRSLILIFVPLIAAAGWSAGVIGLLGVELNVISAFTLAVLAGLGIDFGVHMLTHYGTERQQGHDVEEALARTFAGLAGPMAIAGVTTACGFGALLAAEFRGFAQMGGLAALGVACALLSFLTLFPALAHLCHRVWPEQVSPVRPWPLDFGIVERPAAAPRLRVTAMRVAGALTILGIGLGVVGLGARFEYNFRNLRPKSVGHGIAWKSAMHGTTRSAVVMLADDAASLEAAAKVLRQEGGGDLVKTDDPWVLTAGSFVPPNQPARLAEIARLRAAFDRGYARLPETKRAELAPLSPLLRVREPIDSDSLPEWVDRWLRDRNGDFGTFGLLYTDLRGSDARQMEDLSEHIAGFRERFPDVRFASSVALLGLVIPGLRSDGPTMLGLAIGGLLFATWIISRSFRRALLVLAPIALGMALTLGVMAAVDLRVNLYNMLVFPLAFGIGVDGAVYVAWAMSQRRLRAGELATTARGVLGSTLTTAAGFGSMVIATNPGLVSLGQLAIVALLSSLAMNLLWLPAVMYWTRKPDAAPVPAAVG